MQWTQPGPDKPKPKIISHEVTKTQKIYLFKSKSLNIKCKLDVTKNIDNTPAGKPAGGEQADDTLSSVLPRACRVSKRNHFTKIIAVLAPPCYF